MRACRVHDFGDPGDVIRIEDAPRPEPGPGQALVEVEAASLNFADILVCQGAYQVRPPLPFTPGLEVAGEVVAVGDLDSGAEDIAIGQRMMAMTVPGDGSFAEYALVDSALALPLPDTMSSVDATAMFVAYQTSWVALHTRAALQPGETLLVHAGAGGVGSAAIKLGVAAGARVIATAGGAQKQALCRELGAEIAIDYRSEDFVDIVNDATDGRGADVIYDPVGGDTFDRSRKCIAWGGRILIVGFASGTIPTAPMNHALVKNYSLVGVHWGGYGDRDPSVIRRAHEALVGLHAEGAISPVIDAIVGLDDVTAAMERLSGRDTTGRVIVVP